MGFTSISQGQQQPRGDDEPSDYLNPRDMVGHLLLVWPVRYERDTYTKYERTDGRPADAVFCDVVDLSVNGDDGKPGKLMRGCKWTQGRLIRDTKGNVGAQDPMLFQIGKDGDAYTVVEQIHNPASVQWAEWWLAAHPTFRPGENQPQSIRQQEQQQRPPASGPIRSTPPYPDSYPMPDPPQGGGVWPPTSGPPATPAAPQAESTMDRLRRQASQGNPYVPSSQPPLPPPPPGVQEENPPF
jgi:hypothetical protein